MGDPSSDQTLPAPLRRRWPVLAGAALLSAAVSVHSGQMLCGVIELPIMAPQRDNPGLFVAVVTGWWLTVAALPAAFYWIGADLVGLTGKLRRRWRLFTLGLVLAIWTVIVVLYATDPWTAGRWALYWPIYYT